MKKKKQKKKNSNSSLIKVFGEPRDAYLYRNKKKLVVCAQHKLDVQTVHKKQRKVGLQSLHT